VCANSGFTADLAYLNSRFGAELPPAGDMGAALERLRDSAGDWLGEYARSPGFASGARWNEWHELIEGGADYRTAEGGTVRTGGGERVFQRGGSIYIGPDSPAGDGWTELSRAS